MKINIYIRINKKGLLLFKKNNFFYLIYYLNNLTSYDIFFFFLPSLILIKVEYDFLIKNNSKKIKK